MTNVGGYASLFPVYANPNAGSWLATQNIGRLYSDASQPLLRALQRGGARGDGNNAGAFSLIINIGSSTANANVGFRVAK